MLSSCLILYVIALIFKFHWSRFFQEVVELERVPRIKENLVTTIKWPMCGLVRVCLCLTMCSPGTGGPPLQGRTLQSRVSSCSLQAEFWLETRVDTPAPQLWEHGDHCVLCSTQGEAGRTNLFWGWLLGREGHHLSGLMAGGKKKDKI